MDSYDTCDSNISNNDIKIALCDFVFYAFISKLFIYRYSI